MSEPARARVLITADAVGGVWQYATDLARALVPHGYDTLLAVMGPGLDPARRAAAEAIPGLVLVDTGLPLDWLANGPEEVAEAARGIAALAEAHGVDLVQLNQPSLAAGVAYAAPVVAVSHSCLATWWAAMEEGPPPRDFAWRADLHGQGLAAAARVICPSGSFADATQAAYALPRRPAAIHNGRALPVPPGAMHDCAFTAGRLWDRAKDAATLDRAAARLGVPLKAAGPIEGPNGERVAFANLHALGSVSEEALVACLSARPVFASAARYEPFGLAVLEAAAAGCALVLADIPTFRELWGDAAILVPPGDDRAFADAIDALIGDHTLRLEMGGKARYAAARFTSARMAADMAALYAELLPARERVAA